MAMRFRLGRVLRLRAQLRQQAQEQVAQVVATMAEVRREIVAVRERVALTRANEETALVAGISADALRDRRLWERALAARETDLGTALAEMGMTLARAREVVIGRRREERQLERLAAQARERQQTEEARADAVLMDELVLARRGRGGGGRG